MMRWILAICVVGVVIWFFVRPVDDEKLPEAPPDPSDVPVVLTFGVDFEYGVMMGLLPFETDQTKLVADMAHVVRKRMRAANVGPHLVRAVDDESFEVRVRELNAGREAELVRLATRLGTIEFLIEVLPQDEILGRADGEEPARRVWPGQGSELKVFKERELEARNAARERGQPYRPSQHRFRLVPEHGHADSNDPARMHLVEVPPRDETFDGSILTNPRMTKTGKGRPAILFDIKTSSQAAFEQWTAKNLLLPLAVVIDGEWQMAPTIRAALKTKIMLLPRRASPADMERDVRELAAVLTGGALPLRPTLRSIEGR